MIKNSNSTKLALGLGLISGSRSTLATAIVAHYLSKQPNAQLAKSRWRFIQSPLVSVVAKFITGGEIVADKLPGIPDRIEAPALLARIASGAVAGAIVSTANRDSVVKGIAVGSIAALASTYFLYFLRMKITAADYIKEPWAGVVEDAAAIGSGILLMR